jgi:hypothetical protein
MIDSRGIWGTPTELPYEGQGGGGFLGIDCVSVNTCTAVGRGPAPDDPGEPMIATESNASETGATGSGSPFELSRASSQN